MRDDIFGFACQQRVLETFPGPDLSSPRWGSPTTTFLNKFGIWIYIPHNFISPLLNPVAYGDLGGTVIGTLIFSGLSVSRLC